MVEQKRPLRLAQDADDSDLRSQMAQRDEEILRLRDLLITRDAELGHAKGRLTSIETGSQSLGEAAARVPIPGATRILQMMIRFVQRLIR
jgi:hypothetical protein